MKEGKVRVYEIEHNGDLDHAVESLGDIAQSVGGRVTGTFETDFDHEESAVIGFEVPEGKWREFMAAVRTSDDLCL